MSSLCRQRHEEAARFGSEQREAAAQQLNLQSSTEQTATAAPVNDSHTAATAVPQAKSSSDAIKGSVNGLQQAEADLQFAPGVTESAVPMPSKQQHTGPSGDDKHQKQTGAIADNSTKDIVMLDAEGDKSAALDTAAPNSVAAASTGEPAVVVRYLAEHQLT